MMEWWNGGKGVKWLVALAGLSELKPRMSVRKEVAAVDAGK